MNNTQINKLSMYMAVQHVCNDNEGIWSKLIPFANAFNEYKEKLKEIMKEARLQELQLAGIASEKEALRQQMVDFAEKVKAALQAYASDHQDHELFNAVAYSVSELKYDKQNVVLNRCQLIHDKAAALLNRIEIYNVDVDVLLVFQKTIIGYERVIPKRRAAKNAGRAATSKLLILFIQADIILKNRMDTNMIQFKKSDPDFYNSYISARSINESAIRHLQEKKEEKDTETSL